MAQPATRNSVRRAILKYLFIALAMFSARAVSAQCTATVTASSTTICQLDNVVLQATPTGMYDYQWFVNGSLSTLGVESLNYFFNTPGTYVFEVQITDFSNCTVISAPVTVTVSALPFISYIGYNGPLCAGTTLQLSSTSGTGTLYSWTGPNGFSSNLQSPTLPNFQPVNIGNYNLVVTANGCVNAAQVFVDTMTGFPTVIADVNNFTTNTNNVCEGDMFQLTSSIQGITSATYSWTGPNSFTSTNANAFNTTVTVADSGVYTLTVTGNSCGGPITLSDTVLVNVLPAPFSSINSNGPLCAGSTLQLTAVGTGGSYHWSGPNNFSSNLQNPSIPNAQPVNSGSYSITATLGACFMYAGINVSIASSTPSVTWYADSGVVLCAGAYAVMQASANDMTSASYLWTGPNGFNSTSQITSNSLINADSGRYYITVTGVGCSGPVTLIDSFRVNVQPCIWPGDVNNDMIADNMDVLDLGLAYAATGPVRPNATYTWAGQYMPDWGQIQFCNQDMKFADCNGNGIITASDTFGIALNYNQVHQKGVHIPQAKSTAWPDLYFDMTGITLTPGTTVSIPIKLGTSSVPMVNVYGVAAQVKITGIAPTNGLTVTAPAGWMGSITDALNFTKWIAINQTDWAYVRTDHNNVSGDGTIAILEYEVPAGSQYQQVQMYFDNVRIIGNTGNIITTVNILDDTATILPTAIGRPVSIISDAVVLPNPSDAQANLQLSIVQRTKAQVTIADITGRNLWSTDAVFEKGIRQLALPAADIAPGMYTIQVKDDSGAIAKTLKWIKR